MRRARRRYLHGLRRSRLPRRGRALRRRCRPQLPTRNIGDKKRVRQEDVDSDYLFVDAKQE
jgi:hypothetical protein